jgi:hypothetical protein
LPKSTSSLLLKAIAVAGLAASANPSLAVCLDEKGNSGYRIPVEAEIRDSAAVVTGEVISHHDLQEDRSDPAGTTATVYRFLVDQTVKGLVERRIEIRSNNDSGRFLMSTGKMYALFLNRREGAFIVNSCGNSGLLEENPGILEPVAYSIRKEGIKDGGNYLLNWPSLMLNGADGERIVKLELEIRCGRLHSVKRIPNDWSVDAGSLAGGYARASAEAGHGSTALWRSAELNGVFDVTADDADCFSVSAIVTTERGSGQVQYSIGYDRFSIGN